MTTLISMACDPEECGKPGIGDDLFRDGGRFLRVLGWTPMRDRLRSLIAYLRLNPGLTAALLLAGFLSLVGANWGRVECWNLDEMAFRGTRQNGLPWGYLKPPLHTYLNHVLIMKPAEAIRTVLGVDHNWQYPFQLMGARLLTLALFCGMIVISYRTAARLAGRKSAVLIALLLATSAGLIKFNHFGTADSPLLFWMVASFAMAVRAALSRNMPEALSAGFLAGLAAADKYNGLGVAISIPACLLATQGIRGVFGKLAWTGAMGVVLGFVLGNPGALFDTGKFVQDFLYNLYTTPVYGGQTKGTGYSDFLLAFPELIGWPATMLVGASLAGTLLLAIRGKLSSGERLLVIGAGAVLLFYYLVMGRSPRIPDRFVLPVVPFLLFVACPSLGRLPWKRAVPMALIVIVISYNLFCSVVLDLRFLSDPRMRALDFAEKHFTKGTTIESSYAPKWDHLPGVHPLVTTLPFATGRVVMFGRIFGDNEVIRKGINQNEVSGYPPDTFTAEGLAKRNPDYITFSNQVFQFTGDGDALRFYLNLDREPTGYRKVFDESWMPRIPWTYPMGVDFLAERMVILRRESAAP
jgi:hypothetical protein